MRSLSQHLLLRKAFLLILALILMSATLMTASVPAAYAQNALATGGNFSSNFNTNHAGWTPVYGTWYHANSAYYVSNGSANKLSSIKHAGTYGDYVYQARLKRKGACTHCDFGLMIRGGPGHLSVEKDWKPEYWFAITKNGYFHVWYMNTVGDITILQDWTASPEINKRGWNTLKVAASGTSLQFYINGVSVWSGTNSGLADGQVGIGFYRDATVGQLLINSASLTVETADPGLNPDVQVDELAAGPEVIGGPSHLSP